VRLRKIAIISACCLLAALCTGTAAPQERPAYPLPASKQDCSLCHTGAAGKGPGALRKGLSALCLDCHPDRVAPAEHKVDIVPPMAVKALPLFEGAMTCVTCHDPHANPYGTLLRKPEAELCLSCHPY
jgi:predicted CXXCH cytochrome family protein